MTFSEGLTLACTFTSAISAFFSVLGAHKAFLSSKEVIEQNNIMIENATRPYISIYGQSINCNGKPHFYLVIKNSGASPATVTSFSYSPDLSKSYSIPDPPRDFLSDIAKSTIAPGQSMICKLDYEKIPEEIVFDMTYCSGKRVYSEHYTVNVRAGNGMLTAKCGIEPDENDILSSNIHVISYTLQEMLQKNL